MTSRARPDRATQRMPSGPRGTVRIGGGQWKRTPLLVTDIPGLRPTPDRVRKTVFSWLIHLFGGSLEGLSVLDLFAGAGALGLEAASRGANPVVLVERDRKALEALRTVVGRLNAHQVQIRRGDSITIAQEYVGRQTRFNIIFLDPPFSHGWLAKVLPLVADLCSSTGLIYAESEMMLESDYLANFGLELVRADKAGDVFYHLLRRNNNE